MPRRTRKAPGRVSQSTPKRRVSKKPKGPSETPAVGKAMTLGSVTVRVRLPSKAEERRNVVQGQVALARAKRALTRPGVQLSFKRDVPSFEADPVNPRHVIRVLGGKREPGVFVGGKFKSLR